MGLLKNFRKFTGKHLWRNPFLNKVPAWRPATLLKQKLRHLCFLSLLQKIFKNTFFVENLRTAASEKKKQQMNYRFNIKNGVTENLLNY